MNSLARRFTGKLADATFEGRHRLKRALHKPRLVGRNSRELAARLVGQFRRDNIAVTSIEELGLASNGSMLDAMEGASDYLDEDIVSEKVEYRMGFEHCTPINPSVVAERFPSLFLWGLDEELLDIAEGCLGLPPAYHGVCVRKERVDNRHTGTRLWHQDGEDVEVLRLLVYLSDVESPEDGPFEYVPASEGITYRDFTDPSAITDDAMRAVVPEARWRRCYGKRGTVIFGRVTHIFHHGKLPRTPRKILSFCYTSRHPRDEAMCRHFSFESGLPYLRAQLTPRQLSCMWKYRHLISVV